MLIWGVGGGPWGQRGKSSKNALFRGKRHDNKILNVQILLSRNFVVIAQAPILEPNGPDPKKGQRNNQHRIATPTEIVVARSQSMLPFRTSPTSSSISKDQQWSWVSPDEVIK